jgi:hypothetical protein
MQANQTDLGSAGESSPYPTLLPRCCCCRRPFFLPLLGLADYIFKQELEVPFRDVEGNNVYSGQRSSN